MNLNCDYNDRCMKCGGKEAEHSTQRHHSFEPDPREPLVQNVIDAVAAYDAEVGNLTRRIALLDACRILERWARRQEP